MLPKPTDMYYWHRIINEKKPVAIKPPLVPPQRVCSRKQVRLPGSQVSTKDTYYDFFDLTGLDDDDNSDEDDDDNSDEDDDSNEEEPTTSDAQEETPGLTDKAAPRKKPRRSEGPV
jgi:hypothetical protein